MGALDILILGFEGGSQESLDDEESKVQSISLEMVKDQLPRGTYHYALTNEQAEAILKKGVNYAAVDCTDEGTLPSRLFFVRQNAFENPDVYFTLVYKPGDSPENLGLSNVYIAILHRETGHLEMLPQETPE